MSRDDSESTESDTLPPNFVWSDDTDDLGAQAAAMGPGCPLGPDALPDHEVIRCLGQGGMGTVFLVRQKHMGRLEAMKVVQPHLIDRPDMVERFLREIRAAGSLEHSNIITVYAAMRTTHGVVFTMKYIEGEDLRKIVEDRGPLPVRLACHYALQAASGLQHAHERGFVHRDIKPANLMLDGNGLVQILDFGLAKAMLEHESATDLTLPAQTLGTPQFMAPEQSRDARKADIRADVYSLGCTLYYLLSGAPPFAGSTRSELEEAHRSLEAQPLDLVRADVPDGLAKLVAKMMAKDPADRYQSPAEVVAALRPFAEIAGPGLESTLPPGTGGVIPEDVAWPGHGVEHRRQPARWLGAISSQPRGRLLAVMAGGLVLVAVLAAFLLNHPGARPPERPRVAYPCEVDIHVTERGGKRLDDRPVLGGGGAFESLQRGDWVYLTAKLEDPKPAHFYVLQIDSRGRAAALFPKDWAPGHLPPAGSERADLRIPAVGELPIDPASPPGLEALICFARSEPLTREENDLLWDLCTGKDFAWEQPATFEKVVTSFVDGEWTKHRGFDPNRSRVRRDPVSQTERIVLTLKERGVAVHSRAMCYPLAAPDAAGAKTGKDSR